MSDESDNTDLPPAALRALAEAEERRKAAKALELPTELGGRDGPEPVRYGDWEKKGCLRAKLRSMFRKYAGPEIFVLLVRFEREINHFF